MTIDIRSVSHPTLTEFAALAGEYCRTVQQSGTMSTELLLIAVHRLLPRLYAAGLDLPSTAILFDEARDGDVAEDSTSRVSAERDDREADRLTHAEWRKVFDQLTERLGEVANYRDVYDPYEPPPVPAEVTGSLADDIADIFGDLVSGLRKWERGETGEALWEWRFGLEAHWGAHATGALRALHALAVRNDFPGR